MTNGSNRIMVVVMLITIKKNKNVILRPVHMFANAWNASSLVCIKSMLDNLKIYY